MASNAVKNVIKRREQIALEGAQITERLDAIKITHYNFWVSFQEQCEKTFHDRTLEQMESYNKRRDMRSTMSQHRYRSSELSLQEQWKMTPPLTIDDLAMHHGYNCPYCLARVGGDAFDDETWEGDARSFFTKWLNQDTTDWPAEKLTAYKSAKKEVEKYFAEAEVLEKRLVELKNEYDEILNDLETIWNMCDAVLGKSEEYESQIAELRKELYPHNRDAYYTD